MKDGFVNRALGICADSGKENLKLAQLPMLQPMDLLLQPRLDRTKKMQAEEFYLGGIVALRHLNQFQLQRLPSGLGLELGVQLLAKNFAIEIVQGCGHEATGYATQTAGVKLGPRYLWAAPRDGRKKSYFLRVNCNTP